jgi:hypothetical protein
MADPSPVLPQSSESLAYRPIAGLAVAGLALACLYTAMVAISTTVALVQGNPFFLPNWMVLLAAGGAVVSFLALRQIQNSEGTRAGTGLARWGLWLSIISGLGYTAYANVTGLALKQQAHAFLTEKDQEGASGFFPRLQEGSPREFYAAFLLTVPPHSRRDIDPGNEAEMEKRFDLATKGAQSQLSVFREHLLVRALKHGGQVEPLGVQDWKYENRSYQVFRTYRVTTAEVLLELVIPVLSAEGGEAGEQRRWFLNLQQVRKTAEQLTPKGGALMSYRKLSRGPLEAWLASQDPDDTRVFTDKTNWEKVVPKEALRQAVRDRVTETFLGPAKKRPENLQIHSDDYLLPWKDVQGKLRLTHPFLLRLSNVLGNPCAVAGGFLVQSKEPVDWERIRPDFEWSVVGMEVTRVITGPGVKGMPPGR